MQSLGRRRNSQMRCAGISTRAVPLLSGVHVTRIRESKGPLVSRQKPAGAAGDVSVWEQSAGHFRRWQAGDHGALDDLVRSLTPVLWHVVRSYGLPADQAEDVVQTAWLTLVRRHESITDAQAVAAWLTTTARREAWRVSKVATKALLVGDEVIETRMPTGRAAESHVVEADEQDRLWHLVSELSPRCQRLLRIIAFDDRPDYAGIAGELGMPVGSIGPTRGRCLAKLKALIGDAEGAHDD
jgi:RNA polymerase sigma factor (sigma-70 family)